MAEITVAWPKGPRVFPREQVPIHALEAFARALHSNLPRQVFLLRDRAVGLVACFTTECSAGAISALDFLFPAVALSQGSLFGEREINLSQSLVVRIGAIRNGEKFSPLPRGFHVFHDPCLQLRIALRRIGFVENAIAFAGMKTDASKTIGKIKGAEAVGIVGPSTAAHAKLGLVIALPSRHHFVAQLDLFVVAGEIHGIFHRDAFR